MMYIPSNEICLQINNKNNMSGQKAFTTPKSAKKNHTAAGFTLMEVMVALSIIAIALSSIISVSSSHASNAAYLRDKTFSYWIASDLMTEIQAKREWPSTGTSSGAVNLLGQDWHWKMEIKQTPDEDVNSIKVEAGLANSDSYSATATGFLAHFKE